MFTSGTRSTRGLTNAGRCSARVGSVTTPRAWLVCWLRASTRPKSCSRPAGSGRCSPTRSRTTAAEVVLAHPLKTRAIASARIKTDRIDSATLAHLLRTDLVPRAYLAPRSLREVREVLRYRVQLVR